MSLLRNTYIDYSIGDDSDYIKAGNLVPVFALRDDDIIFDLTIPTRDDSYNFFEIWVACSADNHLTSYARMLS